MIKIVSNGKIKEKFLKEAIEEYRKRITRYSKIELIELPDYDFDNINLTLEKEKDNILKNINSKDFVITLEIEGKNLTSEEFAKKIDNTLIVNSNIVFVIGGSYGLHDEIKNRSDFKLSFSTFTFPHQLFKVILLEQIYRAFKIIKNESYHK